MSLTDRIAEIVNTLVFDLVDAIINLVMSFADALAAPFSGKSNVGNAAN